MEAGKKRLAGDIVRQAVPGLSHNLVHTQGV